MKRNFMVALLALSLLVPVGGALADGRDERKFERFEDRRFDRPFGFRNFRVDDDRFFFRNFEDDDKFFFRNFEDDDRFFFRDFEDDDKFFFRGFEDFDD